MMKRMTEKLVAYSLGPYWPIENRGRLMRPDDPTAALKTAA